MLKVITIVYRLFDKSLFGLQTCQGYVCKKVSHSDVVLTLFTPLLSKSPNTAVRKYSTASESPAFRTW